MSPTCETFIRSVLERNWRDAFLNLNGLNMYEMLRGLAALDRYDLDELWAERTRFEGSINLPRIAYAHATITGGKVPATAPSGLPGDQVQEAKAYARHPTPLTFEHDLTGQLPAVAGTPPTLTEADFQRAALELGVEVAAIMAVAQVEAGGRAGFAADGRPIIRYELHVFHRRTKGHYHKTHPHLSQPTLAAGNPYHRGGQANEWSLVLGAMILRPGNVRAVDAWFSTSWGMFQIMGFNAVRIGMGEIHNFVENMFASEAQHLRAFIAFCRTHHLVRHIQTHDWAAFARGYNGAGYAVNKYDERIGAAFARISAERRRRGLAP